MADIYSYGLVMWEMARRCVTGGTGSKSHGRYENCESQTPFGDKSLKFCIIPKLHSAHQTWLKLFNGYSIFSTWQNYSKAVNIESDVKKNDSISLSDLDELLSRQTSYFVAFFDVIVMPLEACTKYSRTHLKYVNKVFLCIKMKRLTFHQYATFLTWVPHKSRECLTEPYILWTLSWKGSWNSSSNPGTWIS